MKKIGISKLFDAISLNFEIAKTVLYGSFVQDSAFRKFINSNLNTHPDDVCDYLSILIKFCFSKDSKCHFSFKSLL